MKRLGLPLLVACAAILAMTGILDPASAQRRRANKVKLGTIAPKNSVYHEVLMRMRQSWRDISGGAVDLTVYPGGVAGDEVTMLRKMRAGQMQAALISGSGMSFLDEGIRALQFPLMFESIEEFDFVRAKMAPVLERRLKEKGFTVLAWGDAGWAYFFAVREFRTPAELRQMKLYTSKGDDDMLRLFSEFGFRAVPLDLTELQANLETGLVEVFAVPPLVAAGYQWFALRPQHARPSVHSNHRVSADQQRHLDGDPLGPENSDAGGRRRCCKSDRGCGTAPGARRRQRNAGIRPACDPGG